MNSFTRRAFLASSAASLPLVSAAASAQTRPARQAATRPVVISSGNGLPAVNRAMELLTTGGGGGSGSDPLEAVVAGVTLVEDDPSDNSVGLGGLPNEKGVVELDASVMHGPTHKAGAVASLQNIRNPAQVALRVLQKTDHVMLVGAGALEFALKMGFKEENLLTEKSREAWLKWRANLNKADKWLDQDQQIDFTRKQSRRSLPQDIPFTTGTIHCAAVDARGDLGACTSTSGLSWKIAGRVGDSPIIGAGMFVDNQVGAAGATGRGEAVIQSCGAFQIVRHMENGLEPTDACLKVLRWIADHTHLPYLLNDRGEPNFDVTLYALRKDGAFGSAAMHKSDKKTFTVNDGAEGRKLECAALFD